MIIPETELTISRTKYIDEIFVKGIANILLLTIGKNHNIIEQEMVNKILFLSGVSNFFNIIVKI